MGIIETTTKLLKICCHWMNQNYNLWVIKKKTPEFSFFSLVTQYTYTTVLKSNRQQAFATVGPGLSRRPWSWAANKTKVKRKPSQIAYNSRWNCELLMQAAKLFGWVDKPTRQPWLGSLRPTAHSSPRPGFWPTRAEERVQPPPPPLKIELHAWSVCASVSGRYICICCLRLRAALAYISQIKTELPVVPPEANSI